MLQKTTKNNFNLYPALALFLLLTVFTPVLAEDAYRWEDANGAAFYGSTPPPGAKNLKKISGTSFSTYSSDRMLSRYPQTQELQSESEANANQQVKGELLPNAGNNLIEGTLAVEHDDQKRITRCEVEVRNPKQSLASNVQVSFQFKDGTLIPAEGPEIIEPESKATYQISSAQLPVEVKSRTETRGQRKPMPEVVIKSRE